METIHVLMMGCVQKAKKMQRLTKKLKCEIIKLYHQGKSIAEISDILRIAEAKVVKVVSPHY
jgi:DNA-directed RNA polymerase specialized sigma24 family protein